MRNQTYLSAVLTRTDYLTGVLSPPPNIMLLKLINRDFGAKQKLAALLQSDLKIISFYFDQYNANIGSLI